MTKNNAIKPIKQGQTVADTKTKASFLQICWIKEMIPVTYSKKVTIKKSQ